MQKVIKFLVIVILSVYSWSALAAENIADKALNFVIKNQAQAMSALWQKNSTLWRAYMQNNACKNNEQAQRLFPVIYNNVEEFSAAITLIYQQNNQYSQDQHSEDQPQLLPTELLNDVSKLVYYSYSYGYMKGYIYRAKVYLHFYPDIKQEFCDKADVMANAELDQWVEQHTSEYPVEIIKEHKLYGDYRAMYANIMYGSKAFQSVFSNNSRYFDAYVYALILAKQEQANMLYQYVMSTELKEQYFSLLLSSAKLKNKRLKQQDRRSIFNNSAYQLQLNGYMLGFMSFYTRMKYEFPELNEAMQQHMPEYLAETMEKLAAKKAQ
jgi:hypothetical protein